MEIKYTQQGDYLLPNLMLSKVLNEKEKRACKQVLSVYTLFIII